VTHNNFFVDITFQLLRVIEFLHSSIPFNHRYQNVSTFFERRQQINSLLITFLYSTPETAISKQSRLDGRFLS